MFTEVQVRTRLKKLTGAKDLYDDEIEEIVDTFSENRCEPGLSFNAKIDDEVSSGKYSNLGKEEPEYYAFWDLLGSLSDDYLLDPDSIPREEEDISKRPPVPKEVQDLIDKYPSWKENNPDNGILFTEYMTINGYDFNDKTLSWFKIK